MRHESFKASLKAHFRRLTGIDPDKINWQKVLRADYSRYGLNGVYMGISPCLECLTKDEEEDDRRFSLYLLDDFDLTGKRVLEYGSGVGDKVQVALDRGAAQVVPVEVGFNYAYLLSFYAFDHRVTVLPSLDLCEGHFDFVFSFDVLEHVIDPLTRFRELSGLLARGGCLCVIAPFDDVDPSYPLHREENKDVDLRSEAGKIGLEFLAASLVTDKYHTTNCYLWRKP